MQWRRITVDLGLRRYRPGIRLLFRPRCLPDNRVRFQASHYPVVAGPVAQPSKAIRPLSELSQAAHQPRSHDFEFSACHTFKSASSTGRFWRPWEPLTPSSR